MKTFVLTYLFACALSLFLFVTGLFLFPYVFEIFLSGHGRVSFESLAPGTALGMLLSFSLVLGCLPLSSLLIWRNGAIESPRRRALVPVLILACSVLVVYIRARVVDSKAAGILSATGLSGDRMRTLVFLDQLYFGAYLLLGCLAGIVLTFFFLRRTQ